MRLIGSAAAVHAVTAPRWILAIIVMVPLLTLLSVTGRVVLNNDSFVGTAVFLLVADALVFFIARIAFQRENILSRWR